LGKREIDSLKRKTERGKKKMGKRKLGKRKRKKTTHGKKSRKGTVKKISAPVGSFNL